MKWLEAGKPWTTGEFEQVERQPYRSLELLGRSPEDEEAYQNELDMTSHHIGSAIESLEQDIVTKQPKIPGAPQRMRDQYNIAQAGAAGPSAHAHDMTVNQIQVGSRDLPRLTEELSTLRAALKSRASQPEHDMAIGAIAEAEVAATQGNDSRVIESLRKAGQWTWEVAKDIGTTLAAEALKKAMGL